MLELAFMYYGIYGLAIKERGHTGGTFSFTFVMFHDIYYTIGKLLSNLVFLVVFRVEHVRMFCFN